MFKNYSIRFVAALLLAQAFTSVGQDRQGKAAQEASLKAAVKKEVAALTAADPRARAAAACALGRMREGAAPAIPYLIDLLSDGTPIRPQESCGNQGPFEDEPWQPE